MILNVIGAAVWVVALGCGGYLFEHAFEIVLANTKAYEFLDFRLHRSGRGVGVWNNVF